MCVGVPKGRVSSLDTRLSTWYLEGVSPVLAHGNAWAQAGAGGPRGEGLKEEAAAAALRKASGSRRKKVRAEEQAVGWGCHLPP